MAVAEREIRTKAASQGGWMMVYRRLTKNKAAMVGAVLVGLFVVSALFAPLLAPYDPLEPVAPPLEPPSASHPLGTDYLGRDILSRIIFGARVSLQVGVAAVGIALVVGTLVGAVSAYYGGWADLIVMRVMEIMLSFPSILLAIAIMAIMGPQLINAMIAVGIVAIPTYARLVRSSVLSVKEHEYTEAAVAIGATDLRIILLHVLPNCLAPLIVQATLGIATAILDTAALSFLGLGAQPPTPEWGAMLSDTREYIQRAPWVMTFPGLAIMISVLGFNLLGDGLRDALDPRLK